MVAAAWQWSLPPVLPSLTGRGWGRVEREYAVALTDTITAVRTFAADCLRDVDWTAWKGFWLEAVFDDRYVVIYFFALLPLLMLFSRQRLRTGIILTGLAFLCYVFGVLYAGLWLLTCTCFFWLGEKFAVECRRKDVLPIGPPLAAILVIGGWYVITMALHEAELPAALNAWLWENVRWIFPLGTRGLAWEPTYDLLRGGAPADQGYPLIYALFWNVHNIGTAYLAVRMLHYFSDIKRDALPAERRTLLNFLAYTCYAPNLIQGPIERFQVFQDEMDTCHERRRWSNVVPASYRIGMGVLKALVSTIFLQPLLFHKLGIGSAEYTYYTQPEKIESFFLLYTGGAIQIYTLYLEFSGYCDVSAGMARLLGYRQVENFNLPWLATSFRDFWRRWHISLSFLLRDYVYIAMGGNRRHVSLNIMVTFFLIGIWHWLKLQAALWGIVMGVFVVINHYWVNWMKRLDERPDGTLPAIRRAWIRVPVLPQVLAWLVTMHAFIFTILVLFGATGSLRVCGEILRRMWVAVAGT